MKFLSAIALVASLSVAAASDDATDYEHARVVPGVLPADSIAALHANVGTLRLLRKTSGDGTNRKYGKAAVKPEDLRRLLASIGDNREVRETTSLRSTLITGDTEPHIDRKVQGDKTFHEDEDVMLLFLNDNEGAYLQIGEDKVLAKKGTLVTFKGNEVVHNTIVPSGTEVRLLGPIASRDLQGVGASDSSEECCEIDPSPNCNGRQCCICGTSTTGCVRQVTRGNGGVTCMCTPDSDWAVLERLAGEGKKVPVRLDALSECANDWEQDFFASGD